MGIKVSGVSGFRNVHMRKRGIARAIEAVRNKISGGSTFSMTLKSDGTVVGWGKYIGNLNVDQDFVQVSAGGAHGLGLSDVIQVSAGEYHSIALKSDGTVVAWGRNAYGEGIVPETVCDIIEISAGHGHNMALKSDGTVIAWGNNLEGQANVPAGLNLN